MRAQRARADIARLGQDAVHERSERENRLAAAPRSREQGDPFACFTCVPSRYLHWRELASGRRDSEDRAEVFQQGDRLVVVVADGAGGMRGGAAASAALVDTVRAVVDNPGLEVRDAELWAGLLKEVDAKLAARKAGETSGVIVVVAPDGVTGASVGDSEAWIVGSTSTDDLTRGQARARLGSGRAVPVGFLRRALEGVLLVATDGLLKYASPARIAATMRDGDVAKAAARLVALAQLPSGGFHDDLALVVVAPG